MRRGKQYLERQLGKQSLLAVSELYNEQKISKLFEKIWKKKKKQSVITPEAYSLFDKVFSQGSKYIDALMTNRYFPVFVRAIESIVYSEVYEVYSPVDYLRRNSMLDLNTVHRMNIRTDMVRESVGGNRYKYYCVLELDTAFNRSIYGSETIDTGLPKMLDEKGIPELPHIKGYQPWTEPRPFWDKVVDYLNSSEYFDGDMKSM